MGTFGVIIRAVVFAAVCGLGLLAAPVRAADAPSSSQKAAPQPPIIWSLADVRDEDIRSAIDRAVAFLKSQQTTDGYIGPYPKTSHILNLSYPVGTTALALLAMLEAGVPRQDPAVRSAMNFVMETPTEHTYDLSVMAMMLAQMPADAGTRSNRRAMETILKKMVDWQAADGMWGYWIADPAKVNAGERSLWGGPVLQGHFASGDRSNTQFAILALWEMAKRGVEIPRPTLQKAAEQFLRSQNDGGWAYRQKWAESNEPKTTPTMDATGLASLFILRDLLGVTGEGLFDGVRSPNCGKPGPMDRAIDKADEKVVADLGVTQGLTALYGSKNVLGHYPLSGYYSYSIGRVGVATGQKHIGEHDWYREGAAYYLQHQRDDGAWVEGYTPEVETSLGILFLAKGQAPILVNKLRRVGDWNNHPRDLANFVRLAESTFEMRFRWQIVDVRAEVEEWLDAPILFISGHEPLNTFTAEEKKKLRQFVERGGTILADNCCQTPAFDQGLRKLAQEIFPETELRKLAPDHQVYSSHFKVAADPKAPLCGLDLPWTWGKLRLTESAGAGASAVPSGQAAPAATSDTAASASSAAPAEPPGTRTVLFYAPWDIGCVWNQNLTTNHRRIFELGINIFRYATSDRPLKRPHDAAGPSPAKSDSSSKAAR